jgi:hypothetical protein
MDRIKSLISHRNKSVYDTKAVGRAGLETFLQDTSLRRILGIDEKMIGQLRTLVGIYREGLNKDDWAGVAIMIRDNHQEKEEWKYRDPDARKLEMHFKSPRPLTPEERERIEKIVREDIEKLERKEKS